MTFYRSVTRMARREHEENRLSWNAATQAHNSHKGDQAKFFRDGGSTLRDEELALLGNLAGQRVAHLQCNSGQDTLSLVKLGSSVVGVDLSDEAIAFAQRLSADSGIPATFVRADVYEWLAQSATQPPGFDVCFCSYGALMWLFNLDSWARGIASILKPGGRLVVVDFHPFALVFDEKKEHYRPYFAGGRVFTEATGVPDYVSRAGEQMVPWGFERGVEGFKNPHPSHEYQWTLAELLTAVLEAGLTLKTYREYPQCQMAFFEELVCDSSGNRVFREGAFNLPLVFGLVAQLPPARE